MYQKFIYGTLLGAAVLFAGCSGGGNKDGNNAESLKFQQFKDSIGVVTDGNTHFSVVTVDYPVSGSEVLVNALKQSLVEYLNLSLDDAKDGQTLVHKGALLKMERVNTAVKEDTDDGIPFSIGYSDETQIIKVFETEKIVTLVAGGYVFVGGPHGMSYSSGATFRKSDGKVMSRQLLKDDAWGRIQDKVAASLCKFFHLSSNAELVDELRPEKIQYDESTNTLAVPAPMSQPYVVDNNVVFCYDVEEISHNAAGQPEVVIPIKDIEQYLTPEAAELFK
ncbi:MAG: hypothetical protein IKS00_07810 [Bacteroidales bacterium]|nr:hypothetical protein [Bacteroidales bacterium]